MCTWKRSNESFCSVWSIFNSTSASILGRGLLCWPLSAAQKAFAKIIVVFKCQASRLPEKKWDTSALMHLHVWVCMLRVTVTKPEHGISNTFTTVIHRTPAVSPNMESLQHWRKYKTNTKRDWKVYIQIQKLIQMDFTFTSGFTQISVTA